MTNDTQIEQQNALTITEQEDSDQLDPQRVRQLVAQLDIKSSQSILSFGSDAQRQINSVANNMLKDVRNKDLGGAGALLNNMVSALRGFQGKEKQLYEKPRFWNKLLGKASGVQSFIQQFESVNDQIDGIANELEQHKQQLLLDITSLDRLYEATLGYYRDLRHYVAAAEQVIEHADQHSLPALKARAEESQTMESAQRLRDFQAMRDEIERRLADLRLTQQVSMQALPSIRLVQENDKGMINKINSTLLNTIPLWRQQLAQTITIYRSHQAAQSLKESSDLTNELLMKNAETLQVSNRENRQQIERGIFDIEAVEQANRLLIATIEEGIQIHEQARIQRKQTEVRLIAAEQELKNALKSTISTAS